MIDKTEYTIEIDQFTQSASPNLKFSASISRRGSWVWLDFHRHHRHLSHIQPLSNFAALHNSLRHVLRRRTASSTCTASRMGPSCIRNRPRRRQALCVNACPAVKTSVPHSSGGVTPRSSYLKPIAMPDPVLWASPTCLPTSPLCT